MILDWAGLDDSSDSRSEDESSGLGDAVSVAAAVMGAASASGVDGLEMGIEANLCRPGCFGDGGFAPVLSLSDPAVLPEVPAWAAVPGGASREGCGREVPWSEAGATLGVPGVLPSFLVMAESFRMDRAEGARV